MDLQPVPPLGVLSMSGATPKCRLCHCSFRRRTSGQKYCERCRLRRSPRKTSPNVGSENVPPSATLKGATHRVHTPALAILSLDGERIPVTIPTNSHIYVDGLVANFDGDALMNAEWRGRAILMFARDIETRTEIVELSREG